MPEKLPQPGELRNRSIFMPVFGTFCATPAKSAHPFRWPTSPRAVPLRQPLPIRACPIFCIIAKSGAGRDVRGSRVSVTVFAFLPWQKMRQAGFGASGGTFAKEPAPAEKRCAPRGNLSPPPDHSPWRLLVTGLAASLSCPRPPRPSSLLTFFFNCPFGQAPRQAPAPPGGLTPNPSPGNYPNKTNAVKKKNIP